MTMPADYALQLRTKLVTCPAINSFSITEEKLLPESGYIRLRASLINGDFLEANVEPGKPLPIMQLLDVLADEIMASQMSPA